MSAFYNENDPKAAAWLRELIRRGRIAPGEVDTRSIEDVTPDDLRGFTQHHFFAGIGVWPLAFRLAGWPDDRPIWSASCPCPPFSSAGIKKACPGCGGANPIPCPSRTGFFICCLCGHAWHADGRHLLPELWRLTRDHRPDVLFGEQVASEDGRTWLDIVRASLEIMVYRLGYSDTCAAGFGAPHIRQRLYWVADTAGRKLPAGASEPHGRPALVAQRHRDPSGLAQPDGGQRDGLADGQGRLGDGATARWVEGDSFAVPGGRPVGLEHTNGRGEGEGEGEGSRDHRQAGQEAPGDVRADDRAALRLRAGSVSGLADDDDQRRDRVEAARLRGRRDAPGGAEPAEGRADGASGHDPDRRGELGRLGDDDDEGLSPRERAALVGAGRREEGRTALQPGGPSDEGGGPGPTNGLWRAADWLLCRDEKWRPVEPGTFPLADAGTFRNRVAELRGAGNAVNLAQAKGFIEAYLDAERRVRLTAVSEMAGDKLDIFA